jgi:hypothetical protein
MPYGLQDFRASYPAACRGNVPAALSQVSFVLCRLQRPSRSNTGVCPRTTACIGLFVQARIPSVSLVAGMAVCPACSVAALVPRPLPT